MSNMILKGGGSAVGGRIERLQIVRSDGTVRESRRVDIHNTIVNTGLDNILTIGGFDQGVDTNNRTMDINYYNNYLSFRYPCVYYANAQWLRMLWFMKIGTDSSNNVTLYDMTDLVKPYVNANQETYSQSHYIPSTENLSIRGTTHDSMIAGDIHSTHRITSNSVKVTEDGTEITEIGFFVGVNRTWTSSWDAQVFTPGDMFCRIALGDNKVTLNAGERLVVTYALTEYAGASTHQAVSDIHLVDGNGDPIKFKDEDGEEHTIGAIARCWMCDGKNNLSSDTTVEKLPGDFRCVHSTADWGYAVGRAAARASTAMTYRVYTLPAYSRTNGSDCISGKRIFLTCWNNDSYGYVNDFRLAYSENLYTDSTTYYNSVDAYGFPSINVNTSMNYGSVFAYDSFQQGAKYLSSAGRCVDNTSDPTPYENRTGTNNRYIIHNPTVMEYKRGDFYRDQEWVIPTYFPNLSSNDTKTLPDPRYTGSIYWMNIRGMLYRIGYFLEDGNLDTFVPCPIYKKRGQVLRVMFRESVDRFTVGG